MSCSTSASSSLLRPAGGGGGTPRGPLQDAEKLRPPPAPLVNTSISVDGAGSAPADVTTIKQQRPSSRHSHRHCCCCCCCSGQGSKTSQHNIPSSLTSLLGENVCNNSKKNVKSHVFWILEKNVKNRKKRTYSFTGHLMTQPLILNYRKSVPVSHQHQTSCSEMRTQLRNYAT